MLIASFFIKRCNVLSAIIEMADFLERRPCIKLCFKLGKIATECYEMLKTARTLTDVDEHSDRPVSNSMQEMTAKVLPTTPAFF
jgi:hypothetical protein